MFRLLVFSLVLTLFGGVNTTLLCQTTCKPQASDAACHHVDESASDTLSAGRTCEDLSATRSTPPEQRVQVHAAAVQAWVIGPAPLVAPSVAPVARPDSRSPRRCLLDLPTLFSSFLI